MQRIEIRVVGHIDRDWSGWIRDQMITHTTDGTTVLTGFVRDRSAIYGLLDRMADLGLELESVATEGKRVVPISNRQKETKTSDGSENNEEDGSGTRGGGAM